MQAAAEQLEFERAGALRDKVRAIERTMESQKMAAFARTELDVVGLARQDNEAGVQLFAVRNGKLIGRDVYLLDAASDAPDDEVLAASSSSSTRVRRPCRRRSCCRSRSPTRPTSRRSCRPDAARPSTCASRSAARSAS